MIDLSVNANLVLTITSAIAMFLSVYVFRGYLSQVFYRWLVLSSVSIGFWSILIVSLNYVQNSLLDGIILCVFITTPIMSSICYFIMSYEFATRKRIPKKAYFLFLIPAFLFIMGVVNPDNMVFAFESAFNGDLNSSVIPGEATKIRFIINVGLGYTLMLMSLGIIISEVIRTDDYNTIYQGVILSGSIISICLLAGLRLLGVMPYGVDLSAVAINMVLVLLILPYTKDKITKIKVNESDGKLGKMNYPVLLIDNKGEVTNMNEKATRILENTDLKLESISEKDEFTVNLDSETKHYQVTPVPLDRKDYSDGSMYILSDITELKGKVKNLEIAQQISSRILRHNVKNKLTPIMGYADMIDSEEYGDKISESAESLAETSNKALELNRYIVDPESVVNSDVAETVRNIVNQSEHDVLVRSKGTDFNATVPRNMTMIVQECIDNSVQHNTKTDIDMRFNLEEKDSNIVITYTDNGSGVPRDELEVLEKMEETDLKHSTGCGIWMMKWMIESTGGEFDIWNDDGIVIQMKLKKSSS